MKKMKLSHITWILLGAAVLILALSQRGGIKKWRADVVDNSAAPGAKADSSEKKEEPESSKTLAEITRRMDDLKESERKHAEEKEELRKEVDRAKAEREKLEADRKAKDAQFGQPEQSPDGKGVFPSLNEEPDPALWEKIEIKIPWDTWTDWKKLPKGGRQIFFRWYSDGEMEIADDKGQVQRQFFYLQNGQDVAYPFTIAAKSIRVKGLGQPAPTTAGSPPVSEPIFYVYVSRDVKKKKS